MFVTNHIHKYIYIYITHMEALEVQFQQQKWIYK